MLAVIPETIKPVGVVQLMAHACVAKVMDAEKALVVVLLQIVCTDTSYVVPHARLERLMELVVADVVNQAAAPAVR